ncbi:MAG: putative quinol monooxygenase [Gemmatimonadales bacterium]
MAEPMSRQSRRIFLGAAGTMAAAVLLESRARPELVPDGAITAFTLIHGIPGMEAALKEHLLSLAAPTRAEAGCITYDLYQLPDRPYEFLRHEVWVGAAALEAHKRTPHIRGSFERRQREGWTTEIVIWNRVPE